MKNCTSVIKYIYNLNGGDILKPEELALMPIDAREFARHKRIIQNSSGKTVDEYLLDLRIFFKFLVLYREGRKMSDENMDGCNISSLTADDFASVTATDVYEYLYYLDTVRGDSPRTRSRKLSALRGFYKYLIVKKKYFEHDPCANIENPKLKKELPKHLSMDESVELLEAVSSDSASKNRTRDFAILTLFLNCGMRLSELAGISLKDVDHSLRSLRVIGKGNKERIVYLNDACRAALGDHITVRLQTTVKPGEDALFVSSRGQRISVKTVQHIVNKYLEAAGLGNKGYSTHKLRHTAATLMYQTGEVDIRVLKDILGHEQLNTTQIYTHVSDKGMEAAMSKNPLSGVKIKKKAPLQPLEEDK